MLTPELPNYFEYIIRDAESYGAVLSEANLEISQLEPGQLNGRHVRLGLPGGEFSCIETSLPLRGNGTFPNMWTLSVILESDARSRQHGIEVRAGSLVIHRPGVEHDGVYGRNFKVACFTVQDQVLAKRLPQLHPQLQDAMLQPWSVFEPPANSRQGIITHFAEAASIVRSDPQVRNSRLAVAQFEEELVCHFLEAVEQQLPAHSIRPKERAAAMVRQIDEYVQEPIMVNASVSELCTMCEVPRRTLDRAFQDAVGMGPATYLRRIRLNSVRRALQGKSAGSLTIADVALEFGFWHLGRFAEQYHQLFGESPHVTLLRARRGNGTSGAALRSSLAGSADRVC